MGQAKARGSFDQRKAASIFHENEQRRLDAWLFENASFDQNKPLNKKQDRNRGAIRVAIAGMLSSRFIGF